MVKQKLQDVHDDVSCKKHKTKEKLVMAKLNNPLFASLQSILLKDIIDICLQYSSVSVCSKCRSYYPSQMLRDNGRHGDCFRHKDVLLFTRRFADNEVIYLSGKVYINQITQTIVFTSEKDEELWNYFKSLLTNTKCSFFGHNQSDNSKFKIEIFVNCKNYSESKNIYSEITLANELFHVFYKLTGMMNYFSFLEEIKMADMFSFAS